MKELNIEELGKDTGPPNRYYVYIWYRCIDNHIFYVGKGSKDRVKRICKSHRNQYFLNFINKYECDWAIVENSLTEHDAYVLENDVCQFYKTLNQCECNIADTSSCNGGAGLPGQLNGMYGKHHTPEVIEKCRQANLDGHNAGENNSQYGISPINRMDKETYNNWRAKQRARKDGVSNPNAHSVYMINIITKEYLLFGATTECCKFIQDNIPELAERYTTLERLRYVIKHSNKTNAIYNNYIFKIFNKKEPIDIDDTVSSLTGRVIRKIPFYERTPKSSSEDVTTSQDNDVV